MTKKHWENAADLTAEDFMEELRRYQKGSVTRRHFLGVTGLGRRPPYSAAPCRPQAAQGLCRDCRAP